jgi:hypothetical protein
MSRTPGAQTYFKAITTTINNQHHFGANNFSNQTNQSIEKQQA